MNDQQSKRIEEIRTRDIPRAGYVLHGKEAKRMRKVDVQLAARLLLQVSADLLSIISSLQSEQEEKERKAWDDCCAAASSNNLLGAKEAGILRAMNPLSDDPCPGCGHDTYVEDCDDCEFDCHSNN